MPLLSCCLNWKHRGWPIPHENVPPVNNLSVFADAAAQLQECWYFHRSVCRDRSFTGGDGWCVSAGNVTVCKAQLPVDLSFFLSFPHTRGHDGQQTGSYWFDKLLKRNRAGRRIKGLTLTHSPPLALFLPASRHFSLFDILLRNALILHHSSITLRVSQTRVCLFTWKHGQFGLYFWMSPFHPQPGCSFSKIVASSRDSQHDSHW